MRKKLLALAVAVGIVAAARTLYVYRHSLFSPSFARAGGTALVYAVQGEPSSDLAAAAALLQRRFDPDGARGLVVAVTAAGEIEFRVPNSNGHDALVDQVKRLARVPGDVEVRVLARQGYDEPVITAATDRLREPGAKDEVPPPPPDPKWAAEVKLGDDYRYHWARLAPSVERVLWLDPTSLRHKNPADAIRVARGLKSGEAFAALSMMVNLLCAVRQVPGEKDPAIFLLTRQEPETRRITGEHVERTRVTEGGRPRGPAVTVRFTREGGDRLFAVTSRNVEPANRGHLPTRLALLLDGEVVSSPEIHAAHRGETQFTGEFTRVQAEDLAALLRGGPLPVRLAPGPIRETSIAGRYGVTR